MKKTLLISILILSFLGGITLEMYLVHEKLLNTVQRMLFPHSSSFVHLLIVDFVSILLSVVSALLIRRLFLSAGKTNTHQQSGA